MRLRDFDLTENGLFRNAERRKYTDKMLLRTLKRSVMFNGKKVGFAMKRYVDSMLFEKYGIGHFCDRYLIKKPENYRRNGLLIGSQKKKKLFTEYMMAEDGKICVCCGRPIAPYNLTLCNQCEEMGKRKSITSDCFRRLQLNEHPPLEWM